MNYAIVDIETTGGSASGSAITEVAILLHDGKQVTERYETLIDPLCPIPHYIQVLTGIDEEMVAQAPTFAGVAAKIYELLSGCIFVAHNVNFDYSFIKHHLSLAGYIFNAPKLCTVRLSRKIKPGLASYSLGKLCTSLDIPMENRHRAGGDATATALLFSKLMTWDEEGIIASMLKKNSKEQALPPNLPRADFDALPQCPGIYYFKDKAGKVVYVGKANNLKKRVSGHFTGHNPNPQRQHFLLDIYAIDFEICGTELMALLAEVAAIKKLWPKYNRALKRYEPKFGLFFYEDRNDYLRLAIGKYNKSHVALHEFQSQAEGTNLLHQLCRDFNLCPELCAIGPCKTYCYGISLQEESRSKAEIHGTAEAYNMRVTAALESLKHNLPSFAIADKGRHDEERSYIWVDKGVFYGMGYIGVDTDLSSAEDVKTALTRYASNRYSTELIHSYAQKYPYKVIHPEKTFVTRH